jgi:hypothetical protein
MTVMYDAATPPEVFEPGIPWGGYLASPHPFAEWSRAALGKAVNAGGLLPIWGGPLDQVSLRSAKPKDEASEAVRQVRSLDGDRVVVAVDLEERIVAADINGAATYMGLYASQVAAEGGRAVCYGPRTLLDLIRKTHFWQLMDPWVAEWETLKNGYPSPGWPIGERGWQYAGDAHHNGKLVDISTIEAAFPLVRKRGATPEASRLSWSTRRAMHRVVSNTSKREHSLVAEVDRPLAAKTREEITRILGLK